MDERKHFLKASSNVSPSMPVEYFILWNPQFEGEVIGHLDGAPIRETVITPAVSAIIMSASLSATATVASMSIC